MDRDYDVTLCSKKAIAGMDDEKGLAGDDYFGHQSWQAILPTPGNSCFVSIKTMLTVVRKVHSIFLPLSRFSIK